MSIVNKIAEPYAQALIDLAEVNNNLIETENDINLVFEWLNSSIDLKKFLSRPLITNEIKKDVIKNIFSEHIGRNTLILILLLIDNGRISIFDRITKKFRELLDRKKQTCLVKITSAVPLSLDQQESITENMKYAFSIYGNTLEDFKLAVKIDPELIGGFTIQCDSALIDVSIRSKLNQMKFQLRKGVVLLTPKY
jgi:F-type H+-transporting ATPase subunit delta